MELLRFVTCLPMLLLLNNRSIVHFCYEGDGEVIFKMEMGSHKVGHFYVGNGGGCIVL